MKKIYSLTFLLMTGLVPSAAVAQQTAGCPTYTSTQSPAVCAGQSFTVGAHTYSTSNTYVDTLHTVVSGCDSIVTTNLTVKPPMVIDVYPNFTTCGCGDTVGLYTPAGSGAATFQWIDCTNDSIITSATYNSVMIGMEIPETGNFAVIVSDEGCTDTSDCTYLHLLTGITEQAMVHDLNVYPNPVTDEATVSFTNTGNGPLSITVVNILGETVIDAGRHSYALQENSVSLNMEGISKGVYLVRISDGTNVVAKRIVLSR